MRIRIEASSGYDVVIRNGILGKTGEYVREACGNARKVMVVTDDRVEKLYGETVRDALKERGFEVFIHVFPHGEKSKNIGEWKEILEDMCRSGLTRSDALIALGGGVTGDMGGFAAACYQRGIDYVQIPTTLLAMVDSSVGGKTAVDLDEGKNQAGAFYQPRIVICDPETLRSLPEEEYRCGCAEIIKYAMIGSREMFDSLMKTPVKDHPEEVIAQCVRMKRDYVLKDERDTGLRMMLNFGHTFGHACEALSGFSILHGEGVAIGMAMIARAAVRKGLMAEEDRDALTGLIRAYGLPVECPWSAEEIEKHVRVDKKAGGDRIRLIVPREIGKCEIMEIPMESIREWLEE